MLPARLKPATSGIERAPRREWPRHRKWVRSHACCVPGCQRGPIEFAHVRSAANSGTALKPPDWFGVSLCGTDLRDGEEGHHAEQHRVGAETFQRKYGINLWALAAEFAARSPDSAMREAMKGVAA